jgi:hypothetical protein
MEPAPPVMNRTRLAVRVSVHEVWGHLEGCSPKMPSAQTLLRYSDFGTAISGLQCFSRNPVSRKERCGSSSTKRTRRVGQFEDERLEDGKLEAGREVGSVPWFHNQP